MFRGGSVFLPYAEDTDVAFLRDADRILELQFIVLFVVVQPDTDKRLQTILVRNGRNQFVPLGARKCSYPANVRFDDGQALAYLGLSDLGTRALVVDVRTEGQPMNPVFQKFANELAQVIYAEAGNVDPGQGHPAFIVIRHVDSLSLIRRRTGFRQKA